MKGNKAQIKKDIERFNLKYSVGAVITNSANGVIYHAKRKSDGFTCVVKVVPKEKCKRWGFMKSFDDPTGYDRVVPIEFKLHFKSRRHSDRVCDVYDWFEMTDVYCLVIEHIIGCDLFELSNKIGSMTENMVRFIMVQIIDIVRKLAKNYVAHRDIKDENIMINLSTYQVKLIDFGCAIEFCENDLFTSFSGTSEFYPYEWFNSGYYCPIGGAVWSIGCLMFTLLTGDVPYADDESIRLNRRRPISVPISPDCLTAINRMLDIHPESRIRLDQIMDLKFFDKSETFDISTNEILPFPTQSLNSLTEAAG